MKKLVCFIGCFLLVLGLGCSSKTMTIGPDGSKIITTTTNEKAYYELQGQIARANAMVQANPKPIMSMVCNGEPLVLYQQGNAPLMVAKQHENQVIKPLTQMGTTIATTGIKGATVYGLGKAFADSIKSDNTTINGDGNSTVLDRSKGINTEVNSAKEGSTVVQDSQNSADSTVDNHSDNSTVDDHTINDDHANNSSYDDHSNRSTTNQTEGQ